MLTLSSPTPRPRHLRFGIALAALILAAPRVAEAHGDDEECGAACDVGQALLIGVPTLYGALALATDVGTIAYLARSRPVPSAWSLAGTLLWVPPTILTSVGVVVYSASAASSNESGRADAQLGLGLSIGGFALSAGSLALQIYAATRPSPITSTASRAPGDAGVRWVGLAPWGASLTTPSTIGATTTFVF